MGYRVFAMQHPQERKQTVKRPRARDKRGEKDTGRDEVQLGKVNEGQGIALKTDFKQQERIENRLWVGEGEK